MEEMCPQEESGFTSGSRAGALFEGIVARWHSLCPGLDWNCVCQDLLSGLRGIEREIECLGLINCFQWHLEDECRSSYHDAKAVLRLKQSIDASNHRRVEKIGEIDRGIARRLRCLRPESPSGRLAPETPGNSYDRLSVLILKRYHLSQKSLRREVLGPGCTAGMSDLLDEQIHDLVYMLDETLMDLKTGKRRLKVYPAIKIYEKAPRS